MPDTPLGEIIFQSLAKNPFPGMRFDHFMEMALYHPHHGYYASPLQRKIGREGDFFTSVSVGDTFGLILSHALEKKWLEVSPHSPLVVVEQGAHDGQLAFDILESLEERDSPLREGIRYCIIEPRAPIRAQLAEKAQRTGYTGALYPVASASEARCEQGIFVCNELLDAFPVRRFRWSKGTWNDLWVTIGKDGELAITAQPAPQDDPDLADFLLDWPDDGLAAIGEGYTTEYCPGLRPWVAEISRLFHGQGAWWIIDYGWEAGQYFDPRRVDGTLQSFRQHRVQACPLQYPGEADLTAHVNFSALVRLASETGLRLCQSPSQGRFLTEASRDWLLNLEGSAPVAGNAARLRQFNTLTHPALLGGKFRVFEFGN